MKRLSAVLLLALAACAQGVPPVAPSPAIPSNEAARIAPLAVGDNDGDGLADGTEDALASRYFPWVWFDSGEDCTAPATSTTPGTVLARVRPHPQDAAKIAVTYAVLYRKDCGDFLGISSHNGDAEAVTMTLAPNAACAYGYGAYAVKTTAHENTSTEHMDEKLLGNSCTWGRGAGGSAGVAKVYSAENKHGNYLSLSTCDAGGFWGSDHCEEAFTRAYTVYNVGEDSARRIDSLANYQFPGEYAWSSVSFCGGLSRSSSCPGPIREKFLSDRLLARAN